VTWITKVRILLLWSECSCPNNPFGSIRNGQTPKERLWLDSWQHYWSRSDWAVPHGRRASVIDQIRTLEIFYPDLRIIPSFRESRLITPLQYSLTDPEKTTKEQLSLEQTRARKLQIICGDACAARLKGTEGQLCEESPKVKGDSAEFVQYSCGTDVYGDAFHFVRKNGCWYLRGLDSSGG
jgi:hypothetical protein